MPQIFPEHIKHVICTYKNRNPKDFFEWGGDTERGRDGEDSGKNMRRPHVERQWRTGKGCRIQSNIFCSPRYGVNFTKYLTKSKACKAVKEGTGEKKGIRRHAGKKK